MSLGTTNASRASVGTHPKTSISGIAPVKEASGTRCWIHMRWACPKFVRQTFQEWAQHSLARSQWARTYYDQQRANRKQHHAIIRSLAFKWIRILYRCWHNRIPSQEALYSATLARRAAPNASVEFLWATAAGFSKISALKT